MNHSKSYLPHIIERRRKAGAMVRVEPVPPPELVTEDVEDYLKTRDAMDALELNMGDTFFMG